MSSVSSDGPVIPNHLYPLKVCRYRKSRDEWKHISKREKDDDDEEEELASELRVVTWNIDYQTHWPIERLNAALKHLETEVFQCRRGGAPDPCCILLQEVHVRALPGILKNEWVRQNFLVTPANTNKWPNDSLYGNVTLIERSVKVMDAKLLEFGSSAMDRTAVLVDVKVRSPNGFDTIVRIINTHLESLQQGEFARSVQLQLCADFLRDDNISGGIVAGDMNAINRVDQELPHRCGLRDSWWRKHANEQEQGYTWGYQGGGDYPKNRLDKILFLPQRGIRLEEPSRIGIGVKTERGWVSDHYGLTTKLHVL